ncbi:hypothetical protein A3D05_03350 [Candidatus Gottesmanbacteria bacterium RIFCSPHIGHO2_02_FULL_40_24]|uniref:NYN domain-containing protein n=1 Tax=Candidatus Gottesmanbacteria bacterium RIFCSPHIGHO2_01_FULL_40_15 TaxID=1798376 RepID=A0A1F5Z0V6_9BACT|nr:MAG: hypothetical protein A2777_02475 [Candidatus Gottesmanbacteria bacterium RIFCSPHIGHO2_01_FULL_40_15]OGG17870.1 MAG: hypothetical protein A3D05_03350 [Candidatus Gottesmanbacteria bacterium RIFCSPHIGHO2_02_FULL_40_24]OGG24712.1 MAG: hypothetical protein A3E42_01530 [Candidatus Gottesmanbacteria bacterium RIFCSPHIGHO2_12_FULL_40_13]
MSCILCIDGENFLHKVEETLKEEGINRKQVDLAAIDFTTLFQDSLKGFTVTRKVFYAAKLHIHPETQKKSEALIAQQRKLRNTAIAHGFEFILAGNVRAQKVGTKVVFREKGVDVKIAVDMVSASCNQHLKTAILCSSDSDLQPAVAELRSRKVEVVYLGFEANPNKGLTYTTNRTILLRNHEVVAACSKVTAP